MTTGLADSNTSQTSRTGKERYPDTAPLPRALKTNISGQGPVWCPHCCEQLCALPAHPGLICCACPWILWAHTAVLGPAHLTPTLVFLSAACMVPQRLTLEPGQVLTSTALVWLEQGLGAFLSQHGSERRLDTLCPGGNGKRERGT